MADDDDTLDERQPANVLIAKLEKNPAFSPVFCCNVRVGLYNKRPFTELAIVRFELIRESHVSVEDPAGDSVNDDPVAKELLADTGSYAPIPDGYRFSFTCPVCGAGFVQAGGIPQRVPLVPT